MHNKAWIHGIFEGRSEREYLVVPQAVAVGGSSKEHPFSLDDFKWACFEMGKDAPSM